MVKIIQLIAVLIASSILGRWYLAELRKARALNLPSFRVYFSLPGVLIILLIILLPILARILQN